MINKHKRIIFLDISTPTRQKKGIQSSLYPIFGLLSHLAEKRDLNQQVAGLIPLRVILA
ncbi:MAG: hypothetical protein MUO54_07945 [Anaerolineales bacterium]|nr:hypothetical protein [Anaerolineales bacterium]